MAVGSWQGGTHSYPQTSHLHVHPSCQGVPLGDLRTFSFPVGAMLGLTHFGQNSGGLLIVLIARPRSKVTLNRRAADPEGFRGLPAR
jgi:hypothetical protein